ncbi:hypothetical protein B0H16DRAFT_1466284 [Mycena metata]|uniref:Uncharacterized protein n=1 Tax=Mycena metata TaxID=1033252 RepID=A0AAD7IAA3_9AGAR|nr:hypothetical protein B0H16DRAFT_1466284 [Mycena metata]
MDFPDQVFWRQQHDFAPKYTHTIRGSSLQRESTRDFSTTNTKFREQEERIREEPDLRPGQSTTNYLEGEQQLIFDGVFIVIKGGREDRCSNEEIILVPHLYTREILRRKLLRVEFSKMWCGMHMNKSVTERRRYACPWSFTCDKQQQSAPKMFAQVWVNQSAGFFQVLSIQQHALGRFVGLEVRPNDDESTAFDLVELCRRVCRWEEWLSGKRHRDELEAEKHCREELKVKSAHSGGSKERLTVQGATPKDIKWVPQARWVIDGNVWTSSGVAAGSDMALAFVEHLSDAKTARVIRGAVEIPEVTGNDDPFAAFHGLV